MVGGVRAQHLEVRADRHRSGVLLRRCWGAWAAYAGRRAHLGRVSVLLRRRQRWQLLSAAFRSWCQLAGEEHRAALMDRRNATVADKRARCVFLALLSTRIGCVSPSDGRPVARIARHPPLLRRRDLLGRALAGWSAHARTRAQLKRVGAKVEARGRTRLLGAAFSSWRSEAVRSQVLRIRGEALLATESCCWSDSHVQLWLAHASGLRLLTRRSQRAISRAFGAWADLTAAARAAVHAAGAMAARCRARGLRAVLHAWQLAAREDALRSQAAAGVLSAARRAADLRLLRMCFSSWRREADDASRLECAAGALAAATASRRAAAAARESWMVRTSRPGSTRAAADPP